MAEIEYLTTDQRGLDSIAFLWEKLKEHQRVRSPYSAGRYSRMTWDFRKNVLLDKAQNGHIRLDIAKDSVTGQFVGYCISSITDKKAGEIESIFIERAYRRHNIGDAFMTGALKWMDTIGTVSRVIGVAVGNEEVFPFYARYGFVPGVYILRPAEKESILPS